jgi:hypothetical protein
VTAPSRTLNAVCPYFTMFPLKFPLRILQKRAEPEDWVLDPFSGRGTTNYAARLLGLTSVGVDSSPVAAALTQAKLANATPEAIVSCAQRILSGPLPTEIPEGEFWERAFAPDVLESICKVRQALMADCRAGARKALRAIVMGALHGPRNRASTSYFSNQCVRTYAPKPQYAVRFWRERNLEPPLVDVLDIIRVRAQRFYTGQPVAKGVALQDDARRPQVFRRLGSRRVRWVITSPPYYGMRTYIPDQWLRNWFLGGPSKVDYTQIGQLEHRSPSEFANQLRAVWENVASVATEDAWLVIRFGGISDRKAHPLSVVKESLAGSSWKIITIKSAGSASQGRRQAVHFGQTNQPAQSEHDIWARLRP